MRTFLRRSASSFGFGAIASAAAALGTPLLLGACSSSSSSPPGVPLVGQTSFISAPAGGGSVGNAEGDFAAGASSGGSSGVAAPTAGLGGLQTATPTRTVQETDLYRLEGTRLYYLNSYRGLMVFDVSNVDQPKLLGRSPIFGDPVDMVVNQGIATVVVGNWYGLTDDGKPFHGSIVRGLDANDPTNIKVLGDAKLGGWVQDDRVVGNVIYAVSQDQGWEYGWGLFDGPVAGGVAIGPYGGSGSNVIVSSVNFAGGKVTPVSSKTYSGYGGVFNVTPSAILLAHPETPPQTPNTYTPPSKTDLVYLDISDAGGTIVERSTLPVNGVVGTWGADNGRWNLDFADGKTAHVVGSPDGNYTANGSYILATVDFSNPDQPVLASSLSIPGTGWVPTARFDTGRMYLSPDSDYGFSGTTTPLEVFDLTVPAAPVLAGQTTVPGDAALMVPSGGNRLFVLGQDYAQNANSSQLSLSYLDVTNPTTPVVIGTSQFGEGWASTPATGTFKAFTVDPMRLGANDGLVVLPFSGWDSGNNAYNDGVQLIEFTPSSIATSGAAHTHGWVERGIFVDNRIVSLSDLALSVVDYSNPLSPKVTAELTLARSVIASQPNGATIAQVSSDWWDNDTTHSDVRVLPTADAEEIKDESGALDTQVAGVDARVFTNGTLDYIVTDVQVPVSCGANGSGGIAVPLTAPDSPNGGKTPATCYGWQQQVQVVDLANGGAKLRGKLALPMDPNGYYGGWGWYGCYVYDWYNGSDVVQVNGSTLAFRRWTPNYAPSGAANSPWVDASSDLFVVDLSNPDAPGVASTVITNDPTGWWGDMKVVGTTLYTTHEEWVDYGPNVQQWTTRYYADRIDLSDIKHPKVGTKINVPGVLVGGTDDGSTLYTIDYRYDGTNTRNDLDVVRVQGNLAYLQSSTPIDGYVGNVIVRGTTAYATAQIYSDKLVSGQPTQDFHQVDLSNPRKPLDRIASGPSGWGWLLDVQGDRAMVTSGWGSDGLDVYKLSAGAAPVYDQFIRTRGWSVNSLTRQDNQLFLSSGYWGVEAVTLQ